jgi:purine-binding chemotaxis protein CheW
MQVLTFIFQHSPFALPIEAVAEVIRTPDLTVLPGSPPGLAGLINLRGRMIPIVDPRGYLGFDTSPTLRHVIIVTKEDELMGLGVEEVESIVETAVQEGVPDMVDEALQPLIYGYFERQGEFVFTWHAYGPFLLWDFMSSSKEMRS